MHPQLAASLLGQPLPPQPGESGEGLVEPRTGDQATEIVQPWLTCRDCGFYGERDLHTAQRHSVGVRGIETRRALTAVAGRMFRR